MGRVTSIFDDVTGADQLPPETLRMFAIWCSESALKRCIAERDEKLPEVHVPEWYVDARVEQAIEVARRFVCGAATKAELYDAKHSAWDCSARIHRHGGSQRQNMAALACAFACDDSAATAAKSAAGLAVTSALGMPRYGNDESRSLAAAEHADQVAELRRLVSEHVLQPR